MNWKAFITAAWHDFRALPYGAFASQLALKFILAFFPAVLIFLTLVGAWIDSDMIVSEFVTVFADVVPPTVLEFLTDSLRTVLPDANFSISSLAFVLLVYTLTSLIRDLIRTLNVVFGTKETRKFWELVILSLLTIFIGTLLFTLVLQTLFLTDELVELLKKFEILNFETFELWWRWPLVALILFVVVWSSYVFLPNLDKRFYKKNIPGALFFALSWFALSFLFNNFLSSIVEYNSTYGVLGTIIFVLFYLELNAYLYIVGGVLNARYINETYKDNMFSKFFTWFKSIIG